MCFFAMTHFTFDMFRLLFIITNVVPDWSSLTQLSLTNRITFSSSFVFSLLFIYLHLHIHRCIITEYIYIFSCQAFRIILYKNLLNLSLIFNCLLVWPFTTDLTEIYYFVTSSNTQYIFCYILIIPIFRPYSTSKWFWMFLIDSLCADVYLLWWHMWCYVRYIQLYI